MGFAQRVVYLAGERGVSKITTGALVSSLWPRTRYQLVCNYLPPGAWAVCCTALVSGRYGGGAKRKSEVLLPGSSDLSGNPMCRRRRRWCARPTRGGLRRTSLLRGGVARSLAGALTYADRHHTW